MSRAAARRPGLWPAILLVLASACNPGPSTSLPPPSDLKAYSIAVAVRALGLAPGSQALGWFHVGKAHERFGEEDRALELYRRAVEADRSLFDAYQSTAYVLSQRKDRMPEAIEAYQQALRCSPTTPGTLSRMGLVFLHMGRLDDALLSLDEEVRGGTADADTHFYRGQVLALLGRHDDAVKSLTESVKMAPQRREAQYALAQSLKALGQDDAAGEAEKRFREIQKREDAAEASQPAVTNNQAAHSAHAGRTWMDAAALFAAESALVRGQKTRAQELQREYFAALRLARQFAPADPEPRRVLIEALEQFEGLPAAARECAEALRELPGEATLAPLGLQLALKSVDASDKEAPAARKETVRAALDLVEKSIAARPGFAEARREAARIILFRLQDAPELMPRAREHAEAAVKLAPTAQNFDVLALAYFRLGRRDLALATLEEGVQRHPADPALKERLLKLREQMQSN